MKRKILFLVTEDWFFYSHFFDRACAAIDSGYDVVVLTRGETCKSAIEGRGIRVLPLRMNRSGMNPFSETASIANILRAYRTERPDLVHHVALKPILYGTLAAKIANVRSVVNAPVGMGYLFTSQRKSVLALSSLVMIALRWLMNHPGSRVILENRDDRDYFVEQRIALSKNISLIRGAGVDTKRFSVSPEPEDIPVVSLVARMLRDKGVNEFVEAARILKGRGLHARFMLVGNPDPQNPASLEEKQLQDWASERVVEWCGFRSDIPDVLAKSNIVCLPSYREGLPKALLEAMACGRAIVATDVSGCREAVDHGVNGFLVQPRNALALADALQKVLTDPSLRAEMGRRGRQRAESEFANEIVVRNTLSLYEELLSV